MGKPSVIGAFVLVLVLASATSGVAAAGGASTPGVPASQERQSYQPALPPPAATGQDAGRLSSLAGPPVQRDVVSGVPGGGDNFTDEQFLSASDDPMEVVFLPDGRMLLIQREGGTWITDPGDGTTDKSLYVDIGGRVNHTSEHGLISIAIDPNFESNGYVYLYYSHDASQKNRIVRLSHQENGGGLDSTADPSSETVLWEASSTWDHCCHQGGELAFGPDGKLYLTTGEDGDGGMAQDLGSTDGKIVRINKDGSIPSDNPYVDDPDAHDSVWASGLRNPFRAGWDMQRERLLIGDVGSNDESVAIEEVNVGEAGANYGWPDCEGDCSVEGTTDPLVAYPHQDGEYVGNSITGGEVYYGDQFPAEYDGAYFFADFTHGWMRFLTFDADGSVDQDRLFATDTNWVTDVAVGPDGALYYVNYVDETVHRITYTGESAPTIQDASADPTSGAAPLSVEFTANASDPDGDDLTYTWTFGDGSQATGAQVSHTYDETGSYQAELEVSDGTTTISSDPIGIEVGTPPVATIEAPDDGAVVNVGETVSYSGSATDAEDGQLGGENLNWSISFTHHQRGTEDFHRHPVQETTGTDGTFDATVPPGHDDLTDVGFEVALEATDSSGLTNSTFVSLQPNGIPTANPTAEPETVPAGGSVALSANATDQIGDSLTYDWEVVSAPSGASPTLPTGADGNVTLAEPGTYEFAVTVTDEYGANATGSVVVEATAGNAAPSADFSWSPTSPATGQNVTFDASNSSDPDGDVTGYDWDFDGDGTYDATGEQVEHAFDAAGNHSVTLRVTDDDGAEATETGTVEVANETLSIAEAVASANEDGDDSRIELAELQQAINWWSTDEPVPETGGQVLSLSELQQLINLWSTDATVDENTDLSE